MNIIGLLILHVNLVPGSWDGPPLQTALARLCKSMHLAIQPNSKKNTPLSQSTFTSNSTRVVVADYSFPAKSELRNNNRVLSNSRPYHVRVHDVEEH
jgi:hypothetical protein